MVKKEKLKLIDEDMYCNKYEMYCDEVPSEQMLVWTNGIGFRNYKCELLCNECNHMEKIILSKEQIRKCKHMLGITFENEPYRNYYCSNNIDLDLEQLISLGIMNKKRKDNNVIYFLTKKGVELVLNKKINDSLYKEL